MHHILAFHLSPIIVLSLQQLWKMGLQDAHFLFRLFMVLICKGLGLQYVCQGPRVEKMMCHVTLWDFIRLMSIMKLPSLVLSVVTRTYMMLKWLLLLHNGILKLLRKYGKGLACTKEIQGL